MGWEGHSPTPGARMAARVPAWDLRALPLQLRALCAEVSGSRALLRMVIGESPRPRLSEAGGRSPPAPTTPTPCPFPPAAPSARRASACPTCHNQHRCRVLSASVPDRPPWAGTSPPTQGNEGDATDFNATHDVFRSEEHASCGVL